MKKRRLCPSFKIEVAKYLSHLEIISSPEWPSAQLFESAVSNAAAGLGEGHVAAFNPETRSKL
jgi:hypothetical protein